MPTACPDALNGFTVSLRFPFCEARRVTTGSPLIFTDGSPGQSAALTKPCRDLALIARGGIHAAMQERLRGAASHRWLRS